ncbi:MAG: nuclear transport factor 2 family protein [Methanocorpusculum sp.]|nr:nuclear transport factor 2 family protein [Methanocorpusculum sp.]
MVISPQTEEQIKTLIRNFETAYNADDSESISNYIAKDIVIFTADSEIHGREEFLQKFISNTIHIGDLEIKAEGVIVWISGDTLYENQSAHFTAVCRGTGFNWEIVQIHVSLTSL